MVRLHHVTKSFKLDEKDTVVIDRISLEINESEIFGLVGGTGSGKSTILRLMTGFVEPDEGEIFLMGQKLDHESKYHLVKDTSMIFQGFHLLSNLNVIENVLLPGRLRSIKKAHNLTRARELLSFVGLEAFENARIRTLSGGQKQRVAIARSLMTQPRVIFCDEPTSALDEEMRGEILKLLRDINQTFGTTIVLVSHDIAVIKTLCHRVAVIEDGHIHQIFRLQPREMAPVSYEEAFYLD